MEPIEYLHLQLRLEGKALAGPHSLRQVEVVPDEELPLMLIARLRSEELVRYYDEALPADLHTELSAAIFEFPSIDPLLKILEGHHIQTEVGHYKTYVFPSLPDMAPGVQCLSKHDRRVKAFGFDGFADQVYVVEQNGDLASACVSVRENHACGEAWVYTAPDYRRQGCAQQAVRAWAHRLLETGKVPFYSHSLKNEVSAILARKLGLLPMFEEVAITQK
ncbi:MAG: GNAT family N-acetyltransferase [Chloroflexota bacterium]|nr:GNAT family N-acetyltransferase [Anaerolineales bacterium]